MKGCIPFLLVLAGIGWLIIFHPFWAVIIIGIGVIVGGEL